MKFCTKCGSRLGENSRFCSNCGVSIRQLEDSMHLLTANGHSAILNATPKLQYQQRKRKAIIFITFLIILLSLVLATVCYYIYSSPVSFDIEFSANGVNHFLGKVCRKVDGQAKVLDPDYDSPASMYGDCYVANIEVKLDGKVAEEVQMRFFNDNDSDSVSSGEIIFYDSDTENEFRCKKAFILALENALCGETAAEKYITSFSKIDYAASLLDHHESCILGEYRINDELKIEISCRRSFSWDWYLCYKIEQLY